MNGDRRLKGEEAHLKVRLYHGEEKEQRDKAAATKRSRCLESGCHEGQLQRGRHHAQAPTGLGQAGMPVPLKREEKEIPFDRVGTCNQEQPEERFLDSADFARNDRETTEGGL